MMYLCTQAPKSKHRQAFVVLVAVIEADTKKEALAKFEQQALLTGDTYFFKAQAEPLVLDKVYRL